MVMKIYQGFVVTLRNSYNINAKDSTQSNNVYPELKQLLESNPELEDILARHSSIALMLKGTENLGEALENFDRLFPEAMMSSSQIMDINKASGKDDFVEKRLNARISIVASLLDSGMLGDPKIHGREWQPGNNRKHKALYRHKKLGSCDF